MSSFVRKAALAIALAIIAFAVLALVASSKGFTPAERQKLELVRKAVTAGIEHGKKVEEAAEQARIEAANSNKVAGLAVDSAQTSNTKAKLAEALEARQFKEFQRAAKENAEMRPIVKAVTGPWWFPGLNALIYGAKKSAISLLVILAGGFVIFVIIKIAITMFTGGTFGAGIKVVGGWFTRGGKRLFSWFGRAGKRLLSFSRRHGKDTAEEFLTATKNVEHETIGSDPH